MLSIDEIKSRIHPIFEQKPISKASLFGSYARGENTPKSDVDILVELNGRLNMLEFIRIKHELEDVLGVSVDLGEFEQLRSRLRSKILSDSILIYEA